MNKIRSRRKLLKEGYKKIMCSLKGCTYENADGKLALLKTNGKIKYL